MKKYYLEVIGGSNPNQLYVVNADILKVNNDTRTYDFVNNPRNGEMVKVAMYPIERTMIKSIEVMDK
jgi:hypothetical protein